MPRILRVSILGLVTVLTGCDEACDGGEATFWLRLFALELPSCAALEEAERHAAAAPLPRSSYVARFDEERDAALDLAIAHGVTELTLYGLGDVLPNEGATVADFVRRARRHGVAVVAPVSHLERVGELARYEHEHGDARFTGWVTEHEFWNGPEAERPARFAHLQAILSAMREQKRDGWVACYLGYPSAEEAAWIADRVDRVYLSMPVSNPHEALRYGRGLRNHRARHALFAGRVPIWPIVYGRGDAHMRPWLERHTITELDAALRVSLGGELAGVALFDLASTDAAMR